MTFDQWINQPDPMVGFCLADTWTPAEIDAARIAWDAARASVDYDSVRRELAKVWANSQVRARKPLSDPGNKP